MVGKGKKRAVEECTGNVKDARRRKTSLVPRLSSSGHIRGEKRGHGRKTWTWGVEEGQMVESKESRRINRFHLSLWGSMATCVITKFM